MTSEVEVKVRSEVKFEVRSSKRIPRCTSIQNFRFLALKMTELWQFEIKSVMYATLILWHSNLIANQTKSIWPKWQEIRNEYCKTNLLYSIRLYPHSIPKKQFDIKVKNIKFVKPRILRKLWENYWGLRGQNLSSCVSWAISLSTCPAEGRT